MARAEIDIAIGWAAQEGWNPCLQDADCFYAADPNGFLLGVLDGEPIASIFVVKYGDSFGFLGVYFVKSEYRGRGYGSAIWQAGLEYLAGRTVGLDGVPAQQGNYKKSGFKLSYSTVRYEGHGGGDLPVFTGRVSVVPLATRSFDEIHRYDQDFFPADRTQFLHCWLNQSQHVALGILHDDRLAGYGVLRPCYSGYRIGPLFADSPALAAELFQALNAHVPRGEAFYFDPPEVNAEAIALAQRHDMTAVFETARMYLGSAPELPAERLFGVTTLELG